jgi:L-fuconolactonase
LVDIVRVFPAEDRRGCPSHPGLRLVIDHLGLPGNVRDEALGPALDPVLRLASHANIAVKASALPCDVTEAYPFPRLHPHFRRVVETFRSERVFWGTDLTHLPCPYRQAVSWFAEELDSLSDADKDWMMGCGMAEWLNWPLPRA